MANTYTWDCRTVNVKTSVDSLQNVVFVVHWRLTGQDEQNPEATFTAIGTQELNTSNIVDFIPFNQLTHEKIVEWTLEAMGEEKVNHMKISVDTGIQYKLNPPIVTMHIEN
jgi:hypothetical protein